MIAVRVKSITIVELDKIFDQVSIKMRAELNNFIDHSAHTPNAKEIKL